MTTHAPASEIAINPKTEKCQRLEAALVVAKAEIAQRDERIAKLEAFKSKATMLAVDWWSEGKFLTNPHDAITNKAAGKVYLICSDAIKHLLSQQTKQEGE